MTIAARSGRGLSPWWHATGLVGSLVLALATWELVPLGLVFAVPLAWGMADRQAPVVVRIVVGGLALVALTGIVLVGPDVVTGGRTHTYR